MQLFYIFDMLQGVYIYIVRIIYNLSNIIVSSVNFHYNECLFILYNSH